MSQLTQTKLIPKLKFKKIMFWLGIALVVLTLVLAPASALATSGIIVIFLIPAGLHIFRGKQYSSVLVALDALAVIILLVSKNWLDAAFWALVVWAYNSQPIFVKRIKK